MLDIGTGDGRFVLGQARNHPDSFVIGIDAVASAMAEASRRAGAKPARGGLENALFVVAALETLPAELVGIATRITVNYPWGSLLRAVALPDVDLLANLAALAMDSASLDILINMHPFRDRTYAASLGLANAALTENPSRLRAEFQRAGFAVTRIENVMGDLAHATSWGSQLHYAGREVWRLRAVRAHG